MSETFVDAGAHFVSLDFNSVTDVDGNLLIMADQVRRAIAWVHKNAASFGGDADRIYVSGTSGGHLAGVALTTDWQKDFGLSPNVLKGGALLQWHVRPLPCESVGARGLHKVHPRDD